MCNSWKQVVCVVICLCVTIMTISGCSSIGAAKGVFFEEISKIPDGKALIYVYYPTHRYLGGHDWDLYVNGYKVVLMKKGGYFPLFISDSTVHFVAIGVGQNNVGVETDAILDVVEKGRIYYVRLKKNEGFSTKVNNSDGREEIKNCVLLKKKLLNKAKITEEKLTLNNFDGKMEISLNQKFTKAMYDFLSIGMTESAEKLKEVSLGDYAYVVEGYKTEPDDIVSLFFRIQGGLELDVFKATFEHKNRLKITISKRDMLIKSAIILIYQPSLDERYKL